VISGWQVQIKVERGRMSRFYPLSWDKRREGEGERGLDGKKKKRKKKNPLLRSFFDILTS
jgi:hypothetical protein